MKEEFSSKVEEDAKLEEFMNEMDPRGLIGKEGKAVTKKSSEKEEQIVTRAKAKFFKERAMSFTPSIDQVEAVPPFIE